MTTQDYRVKVVYKIIIYHCDISISHRRAYPGTRGLKNRRL